MKEVKFKKFIYLFISYLQNFAVDPNAIFNVRINKLRNKNFFDDDDWIRTIERANHLPTETLQYKILELTYFLPAFTRESQ